MKKYIIVLFILLSAVSTTQSGMLVIAGGGVADVGGSCDDCSGTTVLAYHAENIDVTLGTPCGCSDGDTTFAASGTAELSATQKSDGTYAMHFPNGEDYYTLDLPIDFDDGVIIQDIYIDTFVNNADIFISRPDTANQIRIEMVGTSVAIDFTAYHEGGDVIDNISVNSNKVEDQWLRIKYYYKVGVAGNDHKLVACDLTPPDTEANCVTIEEDDDLVANTTASTNINFGVFDALDAAIYTDNVDINANSGY